MNVCLCVHMQINIRIGDGDSEWDRYDDLLEFLWLLVYMSLYEHAFGELRLV